jgi:hypothetical protein
VNIIKNPRNKMDGNIKEITFEDVIVNQYVIVSSGEI